MTEEQGMAPGKFITFEGGEGAGKSTQRARLHELLQAEGLDVIATYEPGGTALADAIRGVLLGHDQADLSARTRLLAFNAARADHLEQVIAPALAAGRWVICDRFADSTRAYQGATDPGLGPAIDWLERFTLAGLRPDLTFILDLPPETGLARAAERRSLAGAGGIDPFERAALDFHRRVRTIFLEIAAADPGRCVVVDAARDADALGEAIWAAVEARLL